MLMSGCKLLGGGVDTELIRLPTFPCVFSVVGVDVGLFFVLADVLEAFLHGSSFLHLTAFVGFARASSLVAVAGSGE